MEGEKMDAGLSDALRAIDPASLSYKEWLDVGMGLKDAGADISVWDAWSRQDAERYNAGEMQSKWASFQGTGISAGTIIHMARKRGWNGGGHALDWNTISTGDAWDPVGELRQYFTTLFQPDDLIGYTFTCYKDDKGKWKPYGGRYDRTRDQLLAALDKDGIATLGEQNAEAGGWINFNPTDGQGRKKRENITGFRFALVEADDMPIPTQIKIMHELRLPVAILVSSGGRSAHAIVHIDAATLEEYEARVAELFAVCLEAGIAVDEGNKDAGRLSRMPGIMRGDKRQCIIPYAAETHSWQEWRQLREKPQTDAFLACFKPLDSFTEEEASWIIPGWMPEEQITLLAADGGLGKTSLWVNILSALSSGGNCILDPVTHWRDPLRVAFCTTEDSISKKLKKKLREAGADERNIITMDVSADKTGELRGFKFGTQKMATFIRTLKPAVCVFDPVQGFIPSEVNMGSRNAMRDCMAPLIALGEEVGTTFLIIVHTNKRKGASGRDRIADSADLWDVARSVWMMGYTEDQGIRYISNEKNNYAPLQETLLFSITKDGQIRLEGKSAKRDRDYQQDYVVNTSRPKRGECKDWIVKKLASTGEMQVRDLEKAAKEAGYSFATIKRAKDELKEDGQITYRSTGFGKEKIWHIALSSPFDELPLSLPEETASPSDRDI